MTTELLTVKIIDINEAPFVTSTVHTVNVPESEVTSIAVADVDASDPDSDALFYVITTTAPVGAPFIVDRLSGNTLICKVKNQYLLTCKVSGYCILASHDITDVHG